MIIDKIKHLALTQHDRIISYRRHIHAHPELSFQEENTSAYIASCLDDLGISYTTGIGGYGIVAVIEGAEPGPVRALRADMDALPITEANHVSYVSKNPGVMHACGHDVHTASLLGVAHILQSLSSDLRGRVRMLFQPAEEKMPGGASLMIKEGALENPRPDSIVGQHVHPELAVGKVGFRPGVMMASADEIYITVRGRGGHGALPHRTTDTVWITAQIITALQSIVSRKANPTGHSVLTIGKMNTIGGATNVIPSEVRLEGTFRTMDERWRGEVHGLIEQIASQTAIAHGGSCEVDIVRGYPCLSNDPALTAAMRNRAEEYLGSEQVETLPIRMTAEDFSYYSQLMPSCFYRLGVANEETGVGASPVHTDRFDVDEDCLRIGPGLMSYLAWKI